MGVALNVEMSRFRFSFMMMPIYCIILEELGSRRPVPSGRDSTTPYRRPIHYSGEARNGETEILTTYRTDGLKGDESRWCGHISERVAYGFISEQVSTRTPLCTSR